MQYLKLLLSTFKVSVGGAFSGLLQWLLSNLVLSIWGLFVGAWQKYKIEKEREEMRKAIEEIKAAKTEAEKKEALKKIEENDL